MRESRQPERTPPEPEMSYEAALRLLRDEGYGRVETGLYTEALDDQLVRLDTGPAPAREQRVRLVRSADEVAIYRVQRAGGRAYVDDSPLAVVRREGGAGRPSA